MGKCNENTFVHDFYIDEQIGNAELEINNFTLQITNKLKEKYESHEISQELLAYWNKYLTVKFKKKISNSNFQNICLKPGELQNEFVMQINNFVKRSQIIVLLKRLSTAHA